MAPDIDPTFVMEFVDITIPPAIVPPAKGKYGYPEMAEIGIVESLITLLDVNVTILFNVPVEVFDTISFVNLELVVPAIDAFE